MIEWGKKYLRICLLIGLQVVIKTNGQLSLVTIEVGITLGNIHILKNTLKNASKMQVGY